MTQIPFFYCTGTAFAFAAFDNALHAGSVSTGKSFWGDYMVNPSQQKDATKYVAGLNGQTYPWDGGGGTAVNVVDTFNINTTNSWAADFASASFIVYLEVNDTIYPGYSFSREGGTGSDVIIKTQSAPGTYGTYFAMSLLNRSLA